MTAVAGVDPSLGATGYAGPDGRTWLLAEKPTLDVYERIERIARRFDRLLGDHHPELVIFEAYGGGGPGRTSTIRGIEIGSALRLACHGRLTPWADFAPNTLKAYATGNGSSEKEAMIAAYETRGRVRLDGIGHDETDALWLRDLGLWLTSDDAIGPHPKTAPKIVDGILDRAETMLRRSSITPRNARE